MYQKTSLHAAGHVNDSHLLPINTVLIGDQYDQSNHTNIAAC